MFDYEMQKILIEYSVSKRYRIFFILKPTPRELKYLVNF